MPGPTDVFAARILIVDDQESNLRLLEYALRRAGYVGITSTADPVAVCALHRLNRYHVILLDVKMPRMNGFEVMAALKNGNDAGEVAILILTADPGQMVQALEAGAAGFLTKPFILVEVVERVRILAEKALQAIKVDRCIVPDLMRAALAIS